MTEWNIQSRAHACEACGRPFADQEKYHTLLVDEKREFRRSDICQDCWQKQYSEGAKDRKGFVSYWQGIYEAPPPPSDPIQKENAESLLRKLIELNDHRYIPAGYILAVMLERKRVLKVKEQVLREGQRLFVYELPRTGEIFTIVDPDLQLNQLEAVQHDVGLLLEHGLNPPLPCVDSSKNAGDGQPETPIAPEASPETPGTKPQAASTASPPEPAPTRGDTRPNA
jgi:hypothetical protein